MPSVVFCDNKDCCFYDDYHERCDVDRLVIKHGVCVGSPRHGRNVSENDLDERLKAENAGLRELVRGMWSVLGDIPCDSYGFCEHRQQCDESGACVFEQRMHELGVEVKDEVRD